MKTRKHFGDCIDYSAISGHSIPKGAVSNKSFASLKSTRDTASKNTDHVQRGSEQTQSGPEHVQQRAPEHVQQRAEPVSRDSVISRDVALRVRDGSDVLSLSESNKTSFRRHRSLAALSKSDMKGRGDSLADSGNLEEGQKRVKHTR